MENMRRDFEEIYNDLYVEYSGLAKRSDFIQRAKSIIYIILCIAILIICNIYFFVDNVEFSNILIMNVAFILLSFFLFRKLEMKNKYTSIYKNNIISSIVKGINSNLNYEPEKEMNKEIYLKSKFNSSFDNYHSEDYIYGILEDGTIIQISELYIEKEEYSIKDNTTKKINLFSGIYEYIKLPVQFNTAFLIQKNSIMDEAFSSRIEVDSAEFEKNFDCFDLYFEGSEEDNKIKIMELLTSDIIEKILEFAKNNSIENRLTIKFIKDELFITIDGYNQFEIPKFKSFIDKETLKGYYDMIDYSIRLANLFTDKITELNR